MLFPLVAVKTIFVIIGLYLLIFVPLFVGVAIYCDALKYSEFSHVRTTGDVCLYVVNNNPQMLVIKFYDTLNKWFEEYEAKLSWKRIETNHSEDRSLWFS